MGPGRAVDAYFAGADIDNLEDLEVDPFRLDVEHRPGTARPDSPDAQTFWLAKSSGVEASLDWKVRDGNYRVVVMNASASPRVAIVGRFILGIPQLYGIGIVVLGFRKAPTAAEGTAAKDRAAIPLVGLPSAWHAAFQR
jgi:hypothetical protein